MEHRLSRRTVTVIGGMNTDICGIPGNAVVMKDSNPGAVTMRPGGVGRNIAQNLSLLGMDVNMVSAVGNDMFGRNMLDNCHENGINTDMVRTVHDRRSSAYLYITDEHGDMLVGVNEMGVTEMITPTFLTLHMQRINRSDAVVLDANLSEETIRFLAKHCTAPMYADPVSTIKAVRLVPILNRLDGLKPNLLEAQALTGKSEPFTAAQALLDAGVKRVFISMGSRGILAADSEEIMMLPPEKVEVVNTNGAGDAATAAMVYGCMNGLGLAETAAAAAKAGALTAACAETNNLKLCPRAILE